MSLAIKSGRVVTVDNVEESKGSKSWHKSAEKRNYRSIMAIPLIDGEDIFGGLEIYSSTINGFSDGDVELLTGFANDLVSGIRLRRTAKERDENLKLMAITNRDVSIQKQKLETVLREIGDAVLVTDKTGKITMANKATEILTGLSADLLVGRKYGSKVKFVSEKSGKSTADVIDKVLKTGQIKPLDAWAALVGEKGNKISVDGMASPINSVDGKTTGCVLVLRDVTKQRNLDRMKSDFVSLASRQLRTPLTGIKWFVELLKESDVIQSTEALKDYVRKIGDSNLLLIGLVNDLLSVSRAESGKLEVCAVKDILKMSVEQQKVLLSEKNIKIKGLEEIPDDLKVHMDVMQMTQVFGNLINNAAIYSKEGSSIWLSTSEKKDKVVIHVRDEGLGIPQNQKGRVFEKFFRADNVAGNVAGSGLGLYVSKLMVRGHKGKIWFESEEGKGTTFFVELPIKQKNG